jgi:predicted SprT family Zn-dependent metalloprotease
MTRSPDAWARQNVRVWARLWGCPSLASANIAVNPRLSASLGMCRPATSSIELSPRLFARGARIRREVLCHEAAHLAVRALHGSGARAHGQEWRRLMTLSGFAPRISIPGPSSNGNSERSDGPGRARAVPGWRYEHRCPVCQFTRFARRPVGAWRCAACAADGLDGGLIVTRLAPGVARR